MTAFRIIVILLLCSVSHTALAVSWSNDPRDDSVRAAYIAEMIAERANALLYGGTSVNGRVFGGVVSNGVYRNNDAWNVPPFTPQTATASRILAHIKKRYRPTQLLQGLENSLFYPFRYEDDEDKMVESWFDLIMSGAYCLPESVGISPTDDVATIFSKLDTVNPGRDGWMRNYPPLTGYLGETPYDYTPSLLYALDTSADWMPVRAWGLLGWNRKLRYFFDGLHTKKQAGLMSNFTPGTDPVIGEHYPDGNGQCGEPWWNSDNEVNQFLLPTNSWNGFTTNLSYSSLAYYRRQTTARYAWAYAGFIEETNSFYQRPDALYKRTTFRKRSDWNGLRSFLSEMRIIPLDYFVRITTSENGECNDYDAFDCLSTALKVAPVYISTSNFLQTVAGDIESPNQRVLLSKRRRLYGEWCMFHDIQRNERPHPCARFAWTSYLPVFPSYQVPLTSPTNSSPHGALSFSRFRSDGDVVFSESAWWATNFTDSPIVVSINIQLATNLKFTNATAVINPSGSTKWPNMGGSNYVALTTNDQTLGISGCVLGGRWRDQTTDTCTNSPNNERVEVGAKIKLGFSNAWAVMEFEYQ